MRIKVGENIREGVGLKLSNEQRAVIGYTGWERKLRIERRRGS